MSSLRDDQILQRILNKVEGIPRQKLLADLKMSPGWSYHGPVQTIENKLGPGRYAEPTYVVNAFDFHNHSYWYHYRILPRYLIQGYLCSQVSRVLPKCLEILDRINLPMDDYEWSEDDGKKITVFSEENGEYSGSGESSLEALYDLYRQIYFEEYGMDKPALSDMRGAIDINLSYQGEDTIIFAEYPTKLVERFPVYFENRVDGYHVGIFKLVEGDFHVITEKLYFPEKWKLKPRSRGATHLAGLNTRLTS